MDAQSFSFYISQILHCISDISALNSHKVFQALYCIGDSELTQSVPGSVLVTLNSHKVFQALSQLRHTEQSFPSPRTKDTLQLQPQKVQPGN